MNIPGYCRRHPCNGHLHRLAPSDPYATLRGLIFHPRKDIDAPWFNAILALTVFSFENYYGPIDLARQTLDPAVYDDMKAIYERSYKGQEGLQVILQRLSARSLKEYLQPELRDPVSFGASPNRPAAGRR